MLLTDLIDVDDFQAAIGDGEALIERLERLKPILQYLKAVIDDPELPFYGNRNEIMESWCFLLAHIDRAIELSTTRTG